MQVQYERIVFFGDVYQQQRVATDRFILINYAQLSVIGGGDIHGAPYALWGGALSFGF